MIPRCQACGCSVGRARAKQDTRMWGFKLPLRVCGGCAVDIVSCETTRARRRQIREQLTAAGCT